MSVATIVAPAGVPARMEIQSPSTAQTADRMEEHITTDLKFLKSRIAESAGKMMRAVMSNEPTSRMASTMTTAVTVAIRRL